MGKDLRFRIADSAQEVEAIHRLNYRTLVLEIPQHPRNADERLVDRCHAEMECQGWITDRDGSHCDFRHVVFEPKHMSAADLEAGHDRVPAGSCSWRNSAARFVREIASLPLGPIAKAAIPLNLSYRVRLTADGTMH